MKIIIMVLMLSGCEMLQHDTRQVRTVTQDCRLITPDGMRMDCKQGGTVDEDSDLDTTTVKHPAGG